MNTHEHSYRPIGNQIESCDCGAARVVVDEATQARRVKAAREFNARVQAAR